MSRDNIYPRQRLRCRRAEAWGGLDHHRGGPDCWRVDERERVGGMRVGVTAPIVSFLSLDAWNATSTTRHVVSSDRGADLSSEQGGINELMVAGVDTSTCCFVAHKISLTCTSRVFLQLCGRLPRGRWTGGTGGWHGLGLQPELHALVKNQNVTHKKIMMAVQKRLYPFIHSRGL